MKRYLPLLAALVLATPALAAGPAQAAAPSSTPAPAAFKSEPPYIQNRICGELMASMARMSAELYRKSRNPRLEEATVMTGTRAMVFVKANADLTDDERARASRIAAEIEKSGSPTQPAIAAYKFCEERAERWLQEGIVTPADMQVTAQEVRVALKKAVSATK